MIQRHRNFPIRWWLAVLFVLGICQIQLGEVIPANGGLGFDGRIYAEVVKTPLAEFFASKHDQYRFQRSLPNLFVGGVMSLFGVEKNDGNIIFAFQIFNLILMMLTAIVLHLTLQMLRVRPRVAFVGHLSLIFNFGVLRHCFFYPVLTDTCALFLAMLSYYFYFSNRKVALALVTVVGAFTWSTAFFTNALLLVLPFRKGNLPSIDKRAARGWAVLATLGVLGAIFYFIFVDRYYLYNGTPTTRPLVPVALVLTLTYIYIGVHKLFPLSYSKLFRREYFSSWRWVAVVFLIGLTLSGIIQYYSSGTSDLTYKAFLGQIVISSLRKPAAFLVGNIAWFGPLFLVLAMYWTRVSRGCWDLGFGSVIQMLFLLFLSLNSTARQLIYGLPFLVVVFCYCFRKQRLSQASLLFWLGLCFVFSRIWYPMHMKAFSGKIFDFPFQHYFMSSGETMNLLMYSIHALVFVVAFFCLRVPKVSLSTTRDQMHGIS